MTLPFWLNRNCPRFDVNDLEKSVKYANYADLVSKTINRPLKIHNHIDL